MTLNQQDYLERQIEMLGKALASVMAKLTGAENVYLPFFITKEFSPEERELLDVDNWPPKDIDAARSFLSDPRWTPELTEQMLEILLIIAERSSDEEKGRISESIEYCLTILNEKSDAISFNRLSIMERVHELNLTDDGI